MIPHIQLSKIAIGTVQFGMDYGISNKSGQTSLAEAKRILQTASLYGINTLDTAYDYGTSEEVIGNTGCLNWNIVSKFPKEASIKGIHFFLAATLNRIQQKKIYGYLAHSAENLIQHPHLWKELLALKEKGEVQKIGYSLYYPEEIDQLFNLGFVPDIVQLPFNILDHRFLSRFGKLKERGVEIHTRSAFLQGLFFIKADLLHNHFEPVRAYIRVIQTAYPSNALLGSALLYHCLSVKEIDKVVIGLNNATQLKENLDNFNLAVKKNMKPEGINIEAIRDLEKIILPVNWPKNS